MLTLIRSISHGKNVNVIVSSHLLPDVERTCDAVLVMKGGAVVTQGDISALREMPELPAETDGRAAPAPELPLAPGAVQLGAAPAPPREAARLQLDIELREPSPRFAAAVGARGGSVTLEDGPRYRFTFPERDAGEAFRVSPLLFEAAREAGAQVRRFHPARRSLEDVFMEAMK
jgi:ABC-2 type transport system ATP-binding protein